MSVKKHFALIGNRLTHTVSPYIHNCLFELSGIDGDYEVFDFPEEELSSNIKNLKSLSGFNVTIPHKTKIIPFIDKIDGFAKICCAVNTVKCGTETIGYNTDGEGMEQALSLNGFSFKGNIAVCGAGGTARTAAFLAALHKCEVFLLVRESGIKRAEDLKNDIEKETGVKARVVTGDEEKHSFDLLINATPCGMFPNVGEMPVSKKTLESTKAVFDAIYNPEKTELLKTAERLNIPASGGMPMLVMQAVKAQEIWNGAKFSEADIRELIIQSNIYMRSIFEKI